MSFSLTDVSDRDSSASSDSLAVSIELPEDSSDSSEDSELPKKELPCLNRAVWLDLSVDFGFFDFFSNFLDNNNRLIARVFEFSSVGRPFFNLPAKVFFSRRILSQSSLIKLYSTKARTGIMC